MKKIITAFVFCFLCGECFSQAGEWVWIKGDSLYGTGFFGTQGVPSAANLPKPLYEEAEWTDNQGNFWMFGGVTFLGTGDEYGDLWRYNPVTNEWTWMKGTGLVDEAGYYGVKGLAAAANLPPARGWGAQSWTDLNGDLWLYGGNSTVRGGSMNDLWMYNIASNTWTWIHGDTLPWLPPSYGTLGVPSTNNTPGGRQECSSTWIDNAGDMWIFGGHTYQGVRNDLWKYNILLNEWTWMNGPNTPHQLGVYGTQGTPDPANVPGSRFAYCTWKDTSGKFWLFGGGYNPSYNDMWMFAPQTNNWTWISGTNLQNDSGTYAAFCTPSINSVPASRYENRARWADNCNNLWMYGGTYEAFPATDFNDLWYFNIGTLEWTFVNGDSIGNLVPVYGTLGVSAPTNQPGSRFGSLAWKDTSGNYYMYGGMIYLSTNSDRMGNDLWKYTPDTSCVVCQTSTAIKENNFTNELLVFPNPTNSSLTISFLSSEKQSVELQIYNTLGKQIYFTKEEITKGKFEKEINVEKWSEGIYFLQVKMKEGVVGKKVVIQH